MEMMIVMTLIGLLAAVVISRSIRAISSTEGFSAQEALRTLAYEDRRLQFPATMTLAGLLAAGAKVDGWTLTSYVPNASRRDYSLQMTTFPDAVVLCITSTTITRAACP